MDNIMYDHRGRVYIIKGDPLKRTFDSFDEAREALREDKTKPASKSPSKNDVNEKLRTARLSDIDKAKQAKLEAEKARLSDPKYVKMRFQDILDRIEKGDT